MKRAGPVRTPGLAARTFSEGPWPFPDQTATTMAVSPRPHPSFCCPRPAARSERHPVLPCHRAHRGCGMWKARLLTRRRGTGRRAPTRCPSAGSCRPPCPGAAASRRPSWTAGRGSKVDPWGPRGPATSSKPREAPRRGLEAPRPALAVRNDPRLLCGCSWYNKNRK